MAGQTGHAYVGPGDRTEPGDGAGRGDGADPAGRTDPGTGPNQRSRQTAAAPS